MTGGLNWYGYVHNNPINHIDPLGLAETDITDEEAAKLKEIVDILNKLVQQIIDKAVAAQKNPVAAVKAEFGEDENMGVTKAENLIKTYKPEGKDSKHEDYVLHKDQEDSKYAGVTYRLWYAARGLDLPVMSPGIRLCDEAVGADKLGHFFQQGYDYWEVEKKKGKAEADKWNRSTEYGTNPLEGGSFGQASTGIASEADMEANRMGAKFYTELDAATKAGKQFKFDLRNYVSAKWNENKNPNVYVEQVGDIVKENEAKRKGPAKAEPAQKTEEDKKK